MEKDSEIERRWPGNAPLPFSLWLTFAWIILGAVPMAASNEFHTLYGRSS